MMTRLRNALLILNAAAAGLAAAVLVAVPSAIPTIAGVALDVRQYLLCYLLAGAELAIAAMCLFAWRSGQTDTVRLAALTLIVLHLGTSAFAVFGYVAGTSPGIWFNIAFRIAISILLLVAIRKPRVETTE